MCVCVCVCVCGETISEEQWLLFIAELFGEQGLMTLLMGRQYSAHCHLSLSLSLPLSLARFHTHTHTEGPLPSGLFLQDLTVEHTVNEQSLFRLHPSLATADAAQRRLKSLW